MSYSAPRSIRTNNPGAINYGPFAQKYGATGTDGRLAIFPDVETGRSAMSALLDTYATKHGLNTVSGIISRWAPRNVDNNSTDAYIKTVASKLGVDPNAPLTKEHRPLLMDAMAQYEAGTASVPKSGAFPGMVSRETSPPTAGPLMANPSGRKYTPEEVIQGRYQFANQLWREPQASPHWASVVAEGLKGIGSGLARSGAEEALTGNRDMTEEAMRNAGNAPDTVTMAKLLLGSGVPDLGKQGMNLIVQDRKAAADRAAELEQRKKLMELQGEQSLAQARALAPIEQEKAAAIARVRGQIERENAEAILPHEVSKAKAIATAKSELEAAERAALRRERAAYAQQHGLKGRDLVTFVETGRLEKAPSRQLSVTDMTKLEEEGQKFSDLKSFAETFKDDYAGYKVGGSTLTGLARIGLPTASKEAASYWQGYDRFKNVVRNNLFGAALTKPEMEAFEKADINPNMDPAIIKKNLELQQKIVANGMRRKAQALILQGYEPRVVAATYGIDLRKDLGIDEDGNAVAPAKTPPPPDADRPDPKQPVKVSSPEEARKLPPGTAIILPDGTPGRVPGGKP